MLLLQVRLLMYANYYDLNVKVKNMYTVLSAIIFLGILWSKSFSRPFCRSRIDPPALELRVGCKVSVTMRCTARRDGRMLTVRTEMLLIVLL